MLQVNNSKGVPIPLHLPIRLPVGCSDTKRPLVLFLHMMSQHALCLGLYSRQNADAGILPCAAAYMVGRSVCRVTQQQHSITWGETTLTAGFGASEPMHAMAAEHEALKSCLCAAQHPSMQWLRGNMHSQEGLATPAWLYLCNSRPGCLPVATSRHGTSHTSCCRFVSLLVSDAGCAVQSTRGQGSCCAMQGLALGPVGLFFPPQATSAPGLMCCGDCCSSFPDEEARSWSVQMPSGGSGCSCWALILWVARSAAGIIHVCSAGGRISRWAACPPFES